MSIVTDPLAERSLWRAVYAVAVVMVLGGFLFSLRSILNPFVLFLLLLLLISPQAGSRYHLLVVSSAAILLLVWLLNTTGFLLAPFILALVLAYVLHPLVERLEGPRVPRAAAILLLVVPALLVIGLGVAVAVPRLSEQIARLVDRFPEFLQSTAVYLESARTGLIRRDLPFVDEQALLLRLQQLSPETVIGFVQERQEALARRIWEGIVGAGRGIGSLLTVLGYIILTPMLAFYLLRDYRQIVERLAGLVPPPQQKAVFGFVRSYDRLLSRYLRGQLIAAAAVGVLTGLGFAAVGFPNALLLGVVAGVFNVVPYLGLIVSLIPALLIAVFSGAIVASLLKIALVFAVVQLLDGAVIGPRIVGESVGLHPVWVILALAMAGFFWGFVGLLIAIPLAVLVKLLVTEAMLRYRNSRLFSGAGDRLLTP